MLLNFLVINSSLDIKLNASFFEFEPTVSVNDDRSVTSSLTFLWFRTDLQLGRPFHLCVCFSHHLKQWVCKEEKLQHSKDIQLASSDPPFIRDNGSLASQSSSFCLHNTFICSVCLELNHLSDFYFQETAPVCDLHTKTAADLNACTRLLLVWQDL